MLLTSPPEILRLRSRMTRAGFSKVLNKAYFIALQHPPLVILERSRRRSEGSCGEMFAYFAKHPFYVLLLGTSRTLGTVGSFPHDIRASPLLP